MAEPIQVAYFDCFSGASGDMLIGSLLDAGLSLDALRAELGCLSLANYQLTTERQLRHGISGTKFNVKVERGGDHHRHLRDIEALLRDSDLPVTDVDLSLAIFRRLGRAEARVHGTTIDQVHFHEVGALDSIVDIVGFAIGLRQLRIDRVFSSPLTLGSGFVDTAHGRLPVPAPATLEILAEAAVPTRPSEAQTELVTPTGAAILCEVAEFRRPAMHLNAVGYGFGTKQLPWINGVRVWLGELEEAGTASEGDVVVELTCNIDDMTAEQLGFAMERLFEAGALDVWFTPIQMKKNRPAVMLSVLTHPGERVQLSRALLTETTTLGVRWQTRQRMIADRELVSVTTPWGPARAKLKKLDGRILVVSPEYEDCARLARGAGIPLSRVYEAVKAGYETQ